MSPLWLSSCAPCLLCSTWAFEQGLLREGKNRPFVGSTHKSPSGSGDLNRSPDRKGSMQSRGSAGGSASRGLESPPPSCPSASGQPPEVSGKRELSKGVSETKGTFIWKWCLNANSPWSQLGKARVLKESRLPNGPRLEMEWVQMSGSIHGSPP